MSSKLPSMKSLIAFEAVARHKSIAQAAAEMSLTSSALSKQIQALENQIGAKLLLRTTRRIEMTEQGKLFADSVKMSLQLLQRSLESIAPRADRHTLRLMAAPAFSALALIPRLSDFKAAYPQATLSFLSDDDGRIPDFDREPIDAAIVFLVEAPKQTDLEFVPIFDRCYLQPFCAPSLLRGGKPLKQAAQLAALPWLKNRKAPAVWDAWLCHAGVYGLKAVEECWFDGTTSVIEAATAGVGVAILGGADSGPVPFENRLVPAHALRLYHETANQYLIYRRETTNRSLFALREWLLREYNPAYQGAGKPARPAQGRI